MPNVNVNIGNVGPSGNATRTIEANTQPLKTTTLGINFDKSNDFTVPLAFKDGPTVYLRPDQVDAMKMALASATRNEELGNAINGSNNQSISVVVNGQTHTMSARDMQSQLSGHGALTGGS